MEWILKKTAALFLMVVVALLMVHNEHFSFGFTAPSGVSPFFQSRPSLVSFNKQVPNGNQQQTSLLATLHDNKEDKNHTTDLGTSTLADHNVSQMKESFVAVNGEGSVKDALDVANGETDEEAAFDAKMMQKAIQLAQSPEGERGSQHSPFPKPVAGAILVAKDGRILGQGRTTYKQDCVEAAIATAGLVATPLREWVVSWPHVRKLRNDISESTLYITLEPSAERKGTAKPPITQLIEQAGIPRVVIGCQDPIPEFASVGSAVLHSDGISVSLGVEREDCENLIAGYSKLANTKLHKMARAHFVQHGRPLGFLHCSVVDSDDIASFARNGNSFGKNFGGQHLSYRDFGSYELAPPPESIWAADVGDDTNFEMEFDNLFNLEFEEEDYQESLGSNPMMPWYEQVDAVVATFPREGNGLINDKPVVGRLNGLKWLATHGKSLPANVERILVMDATDLRDLPLTNDDPNLPKGINIEEFWKSHGRKATRVLLRHGGNAQAIAAATAAANAAAAASLAVQSAKDAIETGDAELAAEAAIECQEAALKAAKLIQKEIQINQDFLQKLTKLGVTVEVMKGGEPIDVMNYLGKRHGFKAVVWRAGCWGDRGVQSILMGAFQWVSAHLAVDAIGGKFWQLMLAERAVQAACGSESKVKIFAEQEDISLEYCDADSDKDCVLTVDGRPVRHVRLDCRVALMNPNRPRELVYQKTEPMKERIEEAPWFL